jgi:hypothetical protein
MNRQAMPASHAQTKATKSSNLVFFIEGMAARVVGMPADK